MIKPAEDGTLLPLAGLRVLQIARHVCHEIQYQRQDVLRDRRRRVADRIGHANALFACGSKINIVGSGRHDANVLEVFGMTKDLAR